jgi:AAA15 family ATPase/GTPase
MLIAFTLQNFRSFLGEQTFSFAAGADRTHESTHCMRTGVKAVPRVSRSAILFGPNASGKTNMLIGLATLRELILHSTSYSDGRLGSWHTPFRFGPSAGQATGFAIDVLLNGLRYR